MQFALGVSPSFSFSPWMRFSASRVRGWTPRGRVRLEPAILPEGKSIFLSRKLDKTPGPWPALLL